LRILLLLLLLFSNIYADISGTVFRDLPINGTELNRYGLFEDNEFGVDGVTVKAYNANRRRLQQLQLHQRWNL